jgi:RNA polymerase sigma-70 factor, ECF subfamily
MDARPAPLLSIENSPDAESRAKGLNWKYRCSTQRMNYSTKHGNLSTPIHLGQARATSRFPLRRSGSRNNAHTATNSRPAAITLPPSPEWKMAQELFQASRARFIRLAYSVLRNQEDAEDAVQNAMISTLLHLRKFEGRSAFTTWFTRIVYNASLMVLRKRKSARIESFPEPIEGDETSWTDKIPAPQPDPEMACAQAETIRSIDALLQKMSPVLRQAFTMTYYGELSCEEAGAVLGVPPRTFKSRVFRAKQFLIRHTQRRRIAPLISSSPRPHAAGAFLT